MSEKNVRGRELAAPQTEMEFDGQMCPLKFDMNCFRIAEDVYEEEYGQDANFAEIAVKLTKGRLGAIMAVSYAALVSGGLNITFPNFQAVFKLTDIPGVRDRMTDLLADALPDPDPDEANAPDPTKEAAAGSFPGAGSGTEP